MSEMTHIERDLDSGNQLRLVEAMADVVAEKGYPATTIADIVARARVSRRTFYEYFTDKDACLLACHTIVGERMRAAVTTVKSEPASTRTLIERSVTALLQTLAAQRNLTYTHFVAMHASGQTTSRARRQVQEMMANQVQDVAGRVKAADPGVKIPSALMATALVGGIGELIVRTVEQRGVDDLLTIAPTVVELITAVMIVSD